MSIRVVCPSCDKAYNLDESLQGKKIQCRECKSAITVAAPGRKERRDDDRPARDDRIAKTARQASPAGRSRRDEEDDEPRRRPADRDRDREYDDEPRRGRRSERSRRDDDDDPREKKNLMPILIGSGVGAVLLIGVVVGGLVFAFRDKSDPNPPPTPVGTQQAAAPAGQGGPAQGAPPGGGDAAVAEGAVPSEMAASMVQQVKRSTAYLRVNLPNRGIAQGSGFFALERGIVITNAHVLGMLRADSLPPRSVDVVINSGEPGEQKMTGTVLGVDRDNDLAVLRVEGDPSRLPPPLPVDSATKLAETQKVYIFGFPLGSALGKNITVTNSAVSSLRRDDNGILKQVQLNGGMHQGNSGGPVTDARGVVVGVSVAIISGTTISFAIPGDFVKQVVNGKITNTEMGYAYRSGSETRLPVRMSCLDPMNRIREVKVDVWTGPAGSALPSSATAPAARPGDGPRQSYSLSIRDGHYVGDVVLPSALGGQAVWIQGMTVNSTGSSQWDKSLAAPPEVRNPVERRAALVQFKVPTSMTQRTLKLNKRLDVTLVKGNKAGSAGEKLEGSALETLEPDPAKKGTRVRLVFGNCPYSRRFEETTLVPPAQAMAVVQKNSPTFYLSDGHACVSVTKHNFRNLKASYKEAVIDLYQSLCNTYEGSALPVPNRTVTPQETWQTKMPLYFHRNGKFTIYDIFLACTFEGVLTTGDRSEAVISLKGRVKGRKELANVEMGKVSGHAG